MSHQRQKQHKKTTFQWRRQRLKPMSNHSQPTVAHRPCQACLSATSSINKTRRMSLCLWTLDGNRHTRHTAAYLYGWEKRLKDPDGWRQILRGRTRVLLSHKQQHRHTVSRTDRAGRAVRNRATHCDKQHGGLAAINICSRGGEGDTTLFGQLLDTKSQRRRRKRVNETWKEPQSTTNLLVLTF